LSLIKVDSLLARTYVGERRILRQAPSSGGIRPPDGPLAEAREGILRLSQRDLAITLRAGELGALKWARVELRAVPGEFRDPLLFREHGGRFRCTYHVSL